MIELMVPRWEQDDEPKTKPETTSKDSSDDKPTELEQLRTLVKELTDKVKTLEKPEERTSETNKLDSSKPDDPKPEDTSKKTPNFPAAPTGGSSGTTDHRAKLLELYQRNPYLAAKYLKDNKAAIAQSAKELI